MLTELIVLKDEEDKYKNEHMNEKRNALIDAWASHGGDPGKSVLFSRMFVQERCRGHALSRRLFVATILEAAVTEESPERSSRKRMVILVLTKNTEGFIVRRRGGSMIRGIMWLLEDCDH
jgi:hypothetical protein